MILTEIIKSKLTSSPSSVKRKLRRNSRQSCSPANSVKPPPKGLFLKKSSNTAGSWCRPVRQYAYAMVTWYRSVSRGGTRSRIERSVSPHVLLDGAAMLLKPRLEVHWCGDLWDLQFFKTPSLENSPRERSGCVVRATLLSFQFWQAPLRKHYLIRLCAVNNVMCLKSVSRKARANKQETKFVQVTSYAFTQHVYDMYNIYIIYFYLFDLFQRQFIMTK